MGFAIGLVLVAIVATILLILRTRGGDGVQVSISQMPKVVSQLKAAGRDSSFAVFLFMPKGRPANNGGEQVNLQYSIENGHLGLDWVLLASPNIADQDDIAAFMRDRGFAANMREMNKVRYMRVEDGDIVDLGVRIATDFYNLNPTDEIDLIVEGFNWKPADAPS